MVNTRVTHTHTHKHTQTQTQTQTLALLPLEKRQLFCVEVFGYENGTAAELS